MDSFQIHTPTSTSLEINVSGLTSGTITLYDPTGAYYGNYSITTSPATWYISSLPGAGHWTWTVTGATSSSYSTTAWLGCGSSSPGCDTAPGTRTVRQTWGDRFAGRLPDSTVYHEYEISLQEGQIASMSLSDTSQPCAGQIEIFAPSNQAHFNNEPVLRWTNGAAVSDISGAVQGVGGSIQAPTTGSYRVRVRTTPGGNCGYYRVHFATTGSSTRLGPVMPTW